MTLEDEIRESLPEIEYIEQQDLRQQVVDVWTEALETNGIDTVQAVPWEPELQETLGGQQITLVDHIRQVVAFSLAITETFGKEFDPDIDADTVFAGALIHDISKVYEMETSHGEKLTQYLPHPHYAVSLLDRIGFDFHVQHIALSHSPNSAVAPATMEAQVVKTADELAVDSLFWIHLGSLYEHHG